jgi:hypothetical protein
VLSRLCHAAIDCLLDLLLVDVRTHDEPSQGIRQKTSSRTSRKIPLRLAKGVCIASKITGSFTLPP